MLFLPATCDFIRQIARVREPEGLRMEWDGSRQNEPEMTRQLLCSL